MGAALRHSSFTLTRPLASLLCLSVALLITLLPLFSHASSSDAITDSPNDIDHLSAQPPSHNLHYPRPFLTSLWGTLRNQPPFSSVHGNESARSVACPSVSESPSLSLEKSRHGTIGRNDNQRELDGTLNVATTDRSSRLDGTSRHVKRADDDMTDPGHSSGSSNGNNNATMTDEELRAKEEEIRAQEERSRAEEEERRAKEEAERLKQHEAERRAKEEAERQRIVDEVARKEKEEANRRAAEAELLAKQEADRKAQDEANRKAQEEADQKTKDEEEKNKKKQEEGTEKEEHNKDENDKNKENNDEKETGERNGKNDGNNDKGESVQFH
ncbi:hypothetical protein BGX28_006648 [Mortierella sp. GBA30]|nr:hypothetical protein BGX28_006648 [Mortierella sp. GBA30]